MMCTIGALLLLMLQLDLAAARWGASTPVLQHLHQDAARPTPEAGLIAASTLPAPAGLGQLSRSDAPTLFGAATGVVLGLRVVPDKTDAVMGEYKVRTAEAWRKRVKGRTALSFGSRLPAIVGYSILMSFAAEYATALPVYGPKDSLAHTRLGRFGLSASQRIVRAAEQMQSVIARFEERFDAEEGSEAPLQRPLQAIQAKLVALEGELTERRAAVSRAQ